MKMRKKKVILFSIVIIIAVITAADVVRILYAWNKSRDFLTADTGTLSEYDVDEAPEPDSAAGYEMYQNPETSYQALLEDDASLLDDGEIQDLAALMQEVTAYGNVAFKTIDDNAGSTESYARRYYQEQFGTASGTLFLIDMDNRNIWIHSDGAVYEVITESYADTITDNVYRHASAGDYYDCAAQAYEQILTLLKGHRIAQPMKYISNALLALILALLLNYGLVSFYARIKKPRRGELLRSGRHHFSYTQPKAYFVRESRTYNPVSSDSGSSGGSSGGGGGGGSSSGGGGGHSF